jgi:hypothetical protein
MRFPYSTTDPAQDAFDSLPRLPLRLHADSRALNVMGLVDSGTTVNVLPYEVGLQLGMVWDDRRANIRLAGALGQQPVMPVFMSAEIADFAPVRRAFAWVQSPNAPLILGQTNFFMEFEVCFYRSSLEFEVKPKSSI